MDTPTPPPASPTPPPTPPPKRPQITYEQVGEMHWLRFAGPLPQSVILGLEKLKYRYRERANCWLGPSHSWGMVVGTVAKMGDLVPGRVKSPGRKMIKEARKALQRASGGAPVTDEAAVEAARLGDKVRAKAQTGAEYIQLGMGKNFQKVVDDAAREVVKRPGALVAKELVPTLAGFDWSGFPAWAEKHIVIQDKLTLRYVPFILNKLQIRAFNFITDQWKRKGIIRQNWCKHRRWGGSILVQGLCFYIANKVVGVECLLMAHRADASADVYRRTQFMEEHCSEKPAELVKKNRSELQWGAPHHSAIRVATADDPNFGHGSTRNVFHATEVARWPEAGSDILVGVLSSIQDAPGTIAILESTAHGVTGVFYRRWNDVEEGRDHVYENFFVGWLDDETCRWEVFQDAWGPLPAEDDPKWARFPEQWRKGEDRLKAMGADWSQIAWRRQMIPTKCEASAENFSEQYPATAEEAFLSTSNLYFPVEAIDPHLKRTQEVELYTPAPRFSLDVEKKRFIPDSHGMLQIWKQPDAGRPYLIGCDTASGIPEEEDSGGSDSHSFRVYDRWSLEEVAAWHGKKDPDLAAADLNALGRMYNNALCVVEVNHSSGILIVVRLLRELKYPNVYRREIVDKGTHTNVVQDPDAHYRTFGHRTGPGSGMTKNVQLGFMHRFIRDGLLKSNDPEFWKECRHFIRKPDGTLAAEKKFHDDRVMAASLACLVLQTHAIEAPVETVKKAPKFLSKAWVSDLMAKSRAKAKGAATRGGDYA